MRSCTPSVSMAWAVGSAGAVGAAVRRGDSGAPAGSLRKADSSPSARAHWGKAIRMRSAAATMSRVPMSSTGA